MVSPPMINNNTLDLSNLNLDALPEKDRASIYKLLQEQKEAQDQLEKRACEQSFYFFVVRCFNLLNPSTTLVLNWHIEYLCHILQDEVERIMEGRPKTHKAVVINVPPRSLKSEIFSIYLNVWAWLRKPSFNIITTSHTLSLSETFARKTMMLIQSPFIQEHWGDKLKLQKENTSEVVTTGGGTRKVTATDSKIIGYGGDIIIVDDPQDPRSANSKADRETAVRFYRESLMSRLNTPDVGIIITIMQRLHVEDQTGWLLENDTNDRILHVCLPAIYDEKLVKIPKIDKYKFTPQHSQTKPYDNEHKLLFPQRFTHQFLEDAKTEFGSIAFAGQFQQSPVAGEGNMIKPDSLVIISREDYRNILAQRRKTYPTNFVVDTASTDKTSSDPSAMMAYKVIDNTVYIIDITAERIDPAYIPERIERYVKINGYTHQSMIKVEPRSSGHSVVATLKRNSKLNIITLKYPKSTQIKITNNSSKIEKVSAILPSLESGRIIFVEGNYLDSFKQEAAEFPYGKHDDRVDVLTMGALDGLFNKNIFGYRGISVIN
jgi:hypothetical protein